MPRGIMYVETRPVSPEREADYHRWYDDTHLAEITSVDGIVAARRFAPVDGNGPFIAIYELDCDDLDGAVEQLAAMAARGEMSSIELLAMEPPPVPRVYREIASLEP